jgi:rhodanese-related sulfurtransferase
MVTRRNDIDARTLRGMLKRGERVTLVDVRKREEHAQGSMPGSVSFDAYDALKAGEERAMEGLKGDHLLQPWTLRRGRCGAAAAPGLRGVFLGGRAGSLEGPLRRARA